MSTKIDSAMLYSMTKDHTLGRAAETLYYAFKEVKPDYKATGFIIEPVKIDEDLFSLRLKPNASDITGVDLGCTVEGFNNLYSKILNDPLLISDSIGYTPETFE